MADKEEIKQEGNESSKVKKTKIYTMPSKFYVEDNSGGGGKNYLITNGRYNTLKSILLVTYHKVPVCKMYKYQF